MDKHLSSRKFTVRCLHSFIHCLRFYMLQFISIDNPLKRMLLRGFSSQGNEENNSWENFKGTLAIIETSAKYLCVPMLYTYSKIVQNNPTVTVKSNPSHMDEGYNKNYVGYCHVNASFFLYISVMRPFHTIVKRFGSFIEMKRRPFACLEWKFIFIFFFPILCMNPRVDMLIINPKEKKILQKNAKGKQNKP